MTEKLLKLLDLATEALTLYVLKTQAEFAGGVLPLKTDAEVAAAKTRKPRAVKEKAAEVEKPVESPFGSLGATAEPAPAAASIEDQNEAKRRCTEVMGLFIRRHLKANPTGLERAKTILNDKCGRVIKQLEELTYADHVKLIPVFEAELEKAA